MLYFFVMIFFILHFLVLLCLLLLFVTCLLHDLYSFFFLCKLKMINYYVMMTEESLI